MAHVENDKVLALYQAVSELAEEGNDIHKLKVSDITNRAGIGKGTAYEYFRTKEELVEKALKYDFFMQYKLLEEKVMSKETFKDSFGACLAWWEEKKNKRRFAFEFVKKSIQEAGWDGKISKMQGEATAMQKILLYMVQLGKKEKIIEEGIPDNLAGLQILSQIIGFCVYMEFSGDKTKEEILKTKDFLYSTIEKSLERKE